MPALRRWTQQLDVTLKARPWIIPLVLLCLAGFTFFWRLGEGALYDWDEAIHAQMAQEMIWRHDPITPHLAGELHFTKPPLYLWQEVLAYKVLGVNEFAARFWAALSAVGAVLMTYLLGRDLFGRAVGVGAALLLLIVNNLPFSHGYNFVSIGRMAMMTGPLALYAVTLVWLAWRGERDRRYVILMGLPLGAAAMTKNVAGLMPLAGIVLYWLLTRPLRKWPWREIGLASALFCLIALPWHILEALRYGQRFFDEYILHNLIERSTRTIDVRYHRQPPWFYLDVIRRGFSYAWVLLPPAVLYGLYRALRRGERAFLLLLLLPVAPLLVYSAAETKLGWYILEMYPALALLAAAFLVRVLRGPWALALIVAFMVVVGWRLPSARAGATDARRPAMAAQILAERDETVLLCMKSDDHPRPASLFYAGRPVVHVLYREGSLQAARPGAAWLLTDTETWEAAGLAGEIICREGTQLLVRFDNP